MQYFFITNLLIFTIANFLNHVFCGKRFQCLYVNKRRYLFLSTQHEYCTIVRNEWKVLLIRHFMLICVRWNDICKIVHNTNLKSSTYFSYALCALFAFLLTVNRYCVLHSTSQQLKWVQGTIYIYFGIIVAVSLHIRLIISFSHFYCGN